MSIQGFSFSSIGSQLEVDEKEKRWQGTTKKTHGEKIHIRRFIPAFFGILEMWTENASVIYHLWVFLLLSIFLFEEPVVQAGKLIRKPSYFSFQKNIKK